LSNRRPQFGSAAYLDGLPAACSGMGAWSVGGPEAEERTPLQNSTEPLRNRPADPALHHASSPRHGMGIALRSLQPALLRRRYADANQTWKLDWSLDSDPVDFAVDVSNENIQRLFTTPVRQRGGAGRAVDTGRGCFGDLLAWLKAL